MTPGWWQPRGVLRRFTFDLLADEMARLRRAAISRQGWHDGLQLDVDLGVDSLELMALATTLAEAVHLGESGIEDYLLARRTLGEWVDVAATGLERYSACLTFRTSGSTGVPKACVHELATLAQEARHLATLLPGRRRVLCAVPPHHVYGFLFSVLLPPELGLRAEDVVDLRGSTPAWLARGARPGDLVIAHPEFWSAAARTVPRFPPEVVGVTSTAPCADDVCAAVESAGLARLVQVYGTSETGGIGARDSHRAPYTLFPFWRFGAGGMLVRCLPDEGERVVAMLDHLTPCGERQLHVGPRVDQGVQVGGANVFPARVREVLERHPAVQDAAVRLMRPDEGTRLKAFVVPRPGAASTEALLEELHRWIGAELTAAERPKAIRVGPALPVTASGKSADWNI